MQPNRIYLAILLGERVNGELIFKCIRRDTHMQNHGHGTVYADIVLKNARSQIICVAGVL